MADRRRPEDLSPPTTPFRPVPAHPQPSGAHPFEGRVTEEHRPLTERINAAYASTPPIVPDETEQAEAAAEEQEGADEQAEPRTGSRPSGAERFAAVLAATTARSTARAERRQAAAEDAPAQEAPAPAAAPEQAQPEQPEPRRPAPVRRTRRARLRLTHIDPWSVMKTAFLLAVALGIVLVVAVAVVWSVLGAAGVWESIDSTVGDVVGDSGTVFRVEDYVGMSRVMGFTMIVAVVDVVLITVIATLGAFLYNLAASLLGGVEVVLAEDDR